MKSNYRTWTVFLVALCALLALMLVPSITALRRSAQIYAEIRGIQQEHERSQRALDGLARSFYLISIVIREFLLDTSPEAGRTYLHQLEVSREQALRYLERLRVSSPTGETPALRQLQQEVDTYWSFIVPVFEWTPEERAQRGTYFLRAEQRPRRQSILAITEEIRRLNDGFFRERSSRINASEREFRRAVEQNVILAFLAGILVAAASILRIFWLERRSQEQHEQAQRTGEELRNLSTRLRHAQEEERKTLSRELHDEVGQKLTALRMELGGLERLRGASDSEFRDRLSEIKALAEQSLRFVRDISAALRPSVLDDLGLAPAIQRQARQFSRMTEVPVAVEIEGSFDALPERHKIYLYRIVQESLTNCAKHAKARKIVVRLVGYPAEVRLSIQDDGVGFDPVRNNGEGLGLVGIEERIRELGGTVAISSEAGKGTRLQVVLATNGAGHE